MSANTETPIFLATSAEDSTKEGKKNSYHRENSVKREEISFSHYGLSENSKKGNNAAFVLNDTSLFDILKYTLPS